MFSRRLFLSSMALLVSLGLSATSFDSSAEQDIECSDWSNVHFSFGPTVNIQKVAESLNFDDLSRSNTTTATSFGGALFLDYRMWIADNTWVSFRLGVDSGSKSNTRLDRNLQHEENMIKQEVGKRDIFRQILQGISIAFSQTYNEGRIGRARCVDANVKNNFFKILRYIGGEEVDIQRDNFITDEIDGGRLGDPGRPNANANFRSFIGKNTAKRISELGNGSILDGLKEIREFVCRQYDGVARAFRHFAEMDLNTWDMTGAIQDTRYTQMDDLQGGNTIVLDNFFGGRFKYVNNFNQLGITAANMGGLSLDDLKNLICSIYFPDSSDDAQLIQKRTTVESNVKTKVHFGICPEAMILVGRYIPGLDGSFYVGAGAVLLCGTLTPEDSMNESKKEKFRKIAPQFAIGFEKRISKNWGVSFEISQTIKVRQQMTDVEFVHKKIKRSTEISRTTMRFMAVYNL